MTPIQPQTQNEHALVGQKYAFATAALLLGIASFISLLGVEKAILAILFGWLALKASPPPALTLRRGWGKAGIVLGTAHLVLIAVILLLAAPILVAAMLYVADVGNFIVRGPKVVMSVPSPDGSFTAYVEDTPSFDPPNQSLLVERSDQRHFMVVADLAGDVDAIQKIVWSPDSRIVVFQSRDYLTATRVTDWQTVRVFLAREWVRRQPSRASTFNAPDPRIEVNSLEFRESDTFHYRLRGSDQPRMIRFAPAAATDP